MALAHLSELPLRLDRKAGGPAYAQIVAQINCLILSEQLSAGDVLPQIRRLAVQLGVNPNTVVRAYDELEQSGLICKRQGSACRVATIPNEPKSIHQRMQGIRPLMDALVNTSRSVGVPIPLLMEELAKYEVHPPEPPGRPPTQVTFSSKKPARSVIDDAPPKISAGQSVDLWQPGDDVID